MNFHIYREITHDNPGKPTYQQLGSTRYYGDALVILDQWPSGYIITTWGEFMKRKNLSDPGI